MNFLLPQGIGDTIWCLMKIQAVAKAYQAREIHCFIQHVHEDPAEFRAMEFVKRFSFVDSVQPYKCSIHKTDPPYILPDGIPNYIDSGPAQGRYGVIDFVMVANGHLHRGGRLENWLPEYPIRWDVMDDFFISVAEVALADEIVNPLANYAVFYMGSKRGNSEDGHNRGSIWKPQDWAKIGNWCDSHGILPIAVGTIDDWPYFNQEVAPFFSGRNWMQMFGFSIGAVIAVERKARFVLSYQSGIGIVPQCMGVPGGVFWRQHGDSISSSAYLTNANEMASGWANPAYIEQGRHLPLLYGIHDADYIISEIEKRGW